MSYGKPLLALWWAQWISLPCQKKNPTFQEKDEVVTLNATLEEIVLAWFCCTGSH